MTIDHVIIFGVGAAGSNVFLNLVATYPDLSYTCVDSDVVEPRNYQAGTQPYTKADVGRPKVQAIQRIIQQQFGKRIEAVNKRILVSGNLYDIIHGPGYDETAVLIDAFDNARSRNLFIDLCKGCSVLHVGFSGQLTGEAVWDAVFTPMKEHASDAAIDVCQLPRARSFIMGLTANAALVASEFIETGKKRNVYYDTRPVLRTY